MSRAPSHPFIYDRPVRPSEFLNRELELRTIFNRLRNGESTFIVGEPRIGKTSMLLQLADEATRRAHLGNDADRLIISTLDLHDLNSKPAYTQANFWEDALKPLQERPVITTITRQLEHAAQRNYDSSSLKRLFNRMGQQEWQLALLLDGFEQLLFHPNFQRAAFFNLMRSLSTNTGGLAIIPASYLAASEMNEQGPGLLGVGSPFFTNPIELRLRPFDEQAADSLLKRAGQTLSATERCFIGRVTGGHPFLLQAMAAALMEAGSDKRQARAAEIFYERAASLLTQEQREKLLNTVRDVSESSEQGVGALAQALFEELTRSQ